VTYGPIRFRSRHLHASFVDYVRAGLDQRGWITPPVNFGARPVTLIDYQPDDRNTQIQHNTISVSLGDYDQDEDEELGAAMGGLRSALYQVFIDVYMQEQALSLAICDDVRDMFQDRFITLIDQITLAPVLNTTIEVDSVVGPDKPSAGPADQFRKYWRTMRIDGRLFFQT
jgi:hypothetical protein